MNIDLNRNVNVLDLLVAVFIILTVALLAG